MPCERRPKLQNRVQTKRTGTFFIFGHRRGTQQIHFNLTPPVLPRLFITVTEFDAGKIPFGQCMLDFLMVIQQYVERERFGVVRNFQPDNLRWEACDQRAFLKIRIAADDHDAVVFCVLPDVSPTRATCDEPGKADSRKGTIRLDRFSSSEESL